MPSKNEKESRLIERLDPPAGLDLIEIDRAAQMIRKAFRVPPELLPYSDFTTDRDALDVHARLLRRPGGSLRVTRQI